MRCAECGAEVADDLSGCPACDADAVESLPVIDVSDVELGIRTEDRYAYVPPGPNWIRRRVHHDPNRWPAMLVLALLLLFAFASWLQHSKGATGSRMQSAASPSRPRLARSTGVSLVLIGLDGMRTLDVDHHRVRPTGVTELPATDGITRAVRAGNHVVVVVDHRAYSMAASLRGPAINIGPAATAFASEHPGRVWLVTYPIDGSAVVHEVDGAGVETVPPTELNGGITVRAAVTGGLVVERIAPDGTHSLLRWDPAHPSDPSVTISTDRLFVAASRNTVASRSTACTETRCDLSLQDLSTGRHRIVKGGLSGGGIAAAAFSGDGRRLAVFQGGGDRYPSKIVDVATGALAPFEGGVLGGVDPAVAWSRDGRWLFFVDTTAGRINAVDVRGHSYSVATPPLLLSAILAS